MGWVAAVKRTQDAQVIDMLGNIWEQVTDGQSTLAIVLEFPR